MNSGNNKIDDFKQVMGNYPTGVTVVTTIDQNGEPTGLTVNSFASVSLEPLLILWSIDKRAYSYDAFQKVDQFAVNILSEEQGDLCQLFSSKVENRFDHCAWSKSAHSLPVLEGSLAVLQCKVYNRVDAGDHTIMIGEVIDITNEATNPLLYHKRTIGPIPRAFYNK